MTSQAATRSAPRAHSLAPCRVCHFSVYRAVLHATRDAWFKMLGLEMQPVHTCASTQAIRQQPETQPDAVILSRLTGQ